MPFWKGACELHVIKVPANVEIKLDYANHSKDVHRFEHVCEGPFGKSPIDLVVVQGPDHIS